MASSPCSVVMSMRHDDEDYELKAKPPDRSSYRYEEHRRTMSYYEHRGSSTRYQPRYQQPPEPRHPVSSTLYRRHTDPKRRPSGRPPVARSYTDYSYEDSDWSERSERSSSSSMRYNTSASGTSSSYRRSSTGPSRYGGRRGDDDDNVSVYSVPVQQIYGSMKKQYGGSRKNKNNILDLGYSDHSSDSSSTREEDRGHFKICSVDQEEPPSNRYGRRSSCSGSVGAYHNNKREPVRPPKILDLGSARSHHSPRSNHSSHAREDDRIQYRRSSTDPRSIYAARPVEDDASAHSVPALRGESPYNRVHPDHRMASSCRGHDYRNRKSSQDRYDEEDYRRHHHHPYETPYQSRRGSNQDELHRSSCHSDYHYRHNRPEQYSEPPTRRRPDPYRHERRSSISRREEQQLLPPLAPIQGTDQRERSVRIDDGIDARSANDTQKQVPAAEPIPESLEEALDNQWAHRWNKQQSHTKDKDAYIEILPGVIDQLRRAGETKAAIQSDRAVPSRCCSCSTDLFCLEDLSYIICPKCEVISPAQVSTGGRVEAMNGKRHGVAIGFTYETFAKVQAKLLRGIP